MPDVGIELPADRAAIGKFLEAASLLRKQGHAVRSLLELAHLGCVATAGSQEQRVGQRIGALKEAGE